MGFGRASAGESKEFAGSPIKPGMTKRNLKSGTKVPNCQGMNMAVNAKNWQELKKPSALEKKAGGGESRPPAAFGPRPLAPGFGTTLTKSLRLVSPTSPSGATATSNNIY